MDNLTHSLFALTLGIACLAAGSDLALNMAYAMSQGFGWNWSENLKPHEDARFASVYTVAIPLAALLIVFFDPLQVTLLAMALNAVVAPLVVFPLLIVMNDKAYLRDRTNGPVLNALVVVVVLLAGVLALVAIPLEVLGA